MTPDCPVDQNLAERPLIAKVGTCTFRERGHLNVIDLYVLKAKPSHWRLFFRVKSRELKQIEFLHAIKKKQDKYTDDDKEQACTSLGKSLDGRGESHELDLPDS